MNERLLGLLVFCGGGWISYENVYLPLASARGGVPDVKLSIAAVFAPFTLIGLMYLVLGERATQFMGTRAEPKPLAYAIMTVTALAGCALHYWLRLTLQSYGYDVNGRF